MFQSKSYLAYVVGVLSILNFVVTDSSNNEDIELLADSPIPIDEFILCRNCGGEIADSHYLFQKLSPASRYAFNETLFQKDKVLIQVVSNSFSFDFPIVTSVQSACEGVGEWQWDESWFPGYIWQPCICPKCSEHLGWVFMPVDTNIDSSKPFFGLVLTSLIGKSYTDSLIKFPVQIDY